jgi:hypothetical protein
MCIKKKKTKRKKDINACFLLKNSFYQFFTWRLGYSFFENINIYSVFHALSNSVIFINFERHQSFESVAIHKSLSWSFNWDSAEMATQSNNNTINYMFSTDLQMIWCQTKEMVYQVSYQISYQSLNWSYFFKKTNKSVSIEISFILSSKYSFKIWILILIYISFLMIIFF